MYEKKCNYANSYGNFMLSCYEGHSISLLGLFFKEPINFIAFKEFLKK